MNVRQFVMCIMVLGFGVSVQAGERLQARVMLGEAQ